ncbi:MAG: hypothetical protein Q7J68_05955 [Thermoplasmata archaeon]|nr:hypothetical protein [Thermoplasmata archaeon]
MNENTDITKKFQEFFYSTKGINNGKILVVSKSIERTRVNICLLKFFLHEMKQKGIFITIDRPHQYTASLLTLHGISQERLVYIDAISRISGETESNVSNVKFINGPYELDFLDEISSISFAAGAVNKHIINFEDIDFVLIDDIAALTKYQEDEGVKSMIESYISSVEKVKSLTAPIVLDINQNQFIYEILSDKCDRMLLINLSKSIFKEITESKTQVGKEQLIRTIVAGLDASASSGGY